MPEISIIIRTFNEERHLPALLDGLDSQTYRNFETIVVDSGSFDLTCHIAEPRVHRLVRIRSEDFTFGHSLNVGIRHSTARLIVIVSAHTIPTGTDWLANFAGAFADPSIAMVYGRQIGPAEAKFSERLDFERAFGPFSKILHPPEFFANNANAAIRRELWERHPFDETLPGLEDVEWAKYWMGQSYQVCYEPSACIFHIHNETWSQVRRRYYREGQAAKWIGILGRRDFPSLVRRELRFLLDDLLHAWRKGQLGHKGGEVARFRYEKLIGTVRGVWDGAMADNPLHRDRLLFDRQYQAVVIRGHKRAAIEQVELKPLRPSEVLIRVAFQAVCATDLEILDGTLGYYKTGLAKYPIVPGHEFSGTVAAVGARVLDIKEGDHVVVECIQGCGECEACRQGNWIGCQDRREVGVIGCNGGYAEYMVAPRRFVHQVPGVLTLKQACLCEPLAVVLKGMKRLERVWGDSSVARACAVIGGGPIGYLAARVLAHQGHRVTIYDRDVRRLACLAGSPIETAEALQGLTRFDAMVEATGNPDALQAVLRGSSPGTAHLLLGLPYGRRDFNFEELVGYDKAVVGSVGSSRADFQDALSLLPELDMTPLTTITLQLSEYAKAWEFVRTREYLKVILQVDASLGGEPSVLNEGLLRSREL